MISFIAACKFIKFINSFQESLFILFQIVLHKFLLFNRLQLQNAIFIEIPTYKTLKINTKYISFFFFFDPRSLDSKMKKK